jgi:hypothetical protein
LARLPAAAGMPSTDRMISPPRGTSCPLMLTICVLPRSPISSAGSPSRPS